MGRMGSVSGGDGDKNIRHQQILQVLSEFSYCRHNVWIDDTHPLPILKNPSNPVGMDNEDCVKMTQSSDIYDRYSTNSTTVIVRL